jgi:tetratricopeptide (TPR) repeat protein
MLSQALALSPGSALILRELAEIETVAGDLTGAEAHIRKALQIDANDAESHAALAEILKRRERYRDAAAAYAKAAQLDPRSEWVEAAEEMREKAIEASIPAEFRELPKSPTVTRGQLAAYIGVRLDRLLATAPKRVTGVATDIRSHWAADWIVTVTQADVMDIFPNHTFQPNANVRRSDLAHIVGDLLRLALPARSAELTKWRASRPRFADLPQTHLSYAAAALAVASGAMSAQAENRFAPTRPATGREVANAIARIEQIASR